MGSEGVKHAKWKEFKNLGQKEYYKEYFCSNCKFIQQNKDSVCPCCKSIMDENED